LVNSKVGVFSQSTIITWIPTSSLFTITILLSCSIKTHGSELCGQERAKWSPKTKHMMNYCVSFTRANVFIIWRHNHSQYLSSCINCIADTKPANTPKIKAIGCHSSMVQIDEFRFHFFFFDGSSQFPFLNCHIYLKLALLLGLLM